MVLDPDPEAVGYGTVSRPGLQNHSFDHSLVPNRITRLRVPGIASNFQKLTYIYIPIDAREHIFYDFPFNGL